MVNKKILILSTYPIEKPFHGGQKRTKAIVDFYKDIFAEVRFVAVFHEKYFDVWGSDDIAIEDPTIIEKIEQEPFIGDVLCGEAIHDDQRVRQKLTKLVDDYQPDVIQLEQIYTFAGLEPLLNELHVTPKLILSSHNIESSMKEEIYANIVLTDNQRQKLLARIKELETGISKKANLVIAVSQADADEHKRMGAKRCVVVPNGIEKVIPTAAAVDHWQGFMEEKKLNSLITFVGSAHPPNLYGFQAMVGKNLSFLPKDSALMLAGGISDYMQEVYVGDTPEVKSFWQRAFPLGKLSDDNLAGLIENTETILLPITEGGGSNLKTAEAILSGKKIVTTSFSFRSFEKYLNLPNIYIADTITEFKLTILRAVKEPYIPRTPKQVELAEQVQWKYCLRPLNNIDKLLYSRPRQIAIKTANIARAQRRRFKELLKSHH